jgi:hypothetical protein
MADLSFSQPERRSYLVPLAIVFLLALAAAFAIYRFFPNRFARLTVVSSRAVPVRTVFSGKGISGAGFSVLGDTTEEDLYTVVTIRIEDDMKLPIFLKDIRATVTEPDGSQQEVSALEKKDVDAVFTTYPALKQAAGPLLLRETEIAPGGSAEGTIVLHFNGPMTLWDDRSGATVTLDTYHQGPLTVSVPK